MTSVSDAMLTPLVSLFSSSTTATCCVAVARPTVSQPASAVTARTPIAASRAVWAFIASIPTLSETRRMPKLLGCG
jgi:hypothetical protein